MIKNSTYISAIVAGLVQRTYAAINNKMISYKRRCLKCEKYFLPNHQDREYCELCRPRKRYGRKIKNAMRDKTMKITAILIMIIILLPYTMAYVINTKTDVIIDFVGNDEYYIRTEMADLGPYNITQQSDKPFSINITRHTETNQTEFERIVDMMTNMTSNCANMSAQLNFTNEYHNAYYSELQTNWSRCTLDKQALMLEVPVLESQLKNITQEGTRAINECSSQKDTALVAQNSCMTSLQNVTLALNKERKSNSQKTMVVIICLVIAGIFIFQEIQKRGKAQPDEMAMLGNS